MKNGASSAWALDSGSFSRAHDAEHPVGPDAGVAVAERAHERRRQGMRAVEVGQHDEVVLRPVSFDDQVPHDYSVGAISCWAVASRSGRVASSHWIRGSRRNHDRWRRTKRRVALTVRSIAVVEIPDDAAGLVETLEHLGVPESLAGGRAAAQALIATARGPRRPGRQPSSGAPGTRPAHRRRRASSPRCTTSGYAESKPGIRALNGCPVSSMTSRARTIRRPLVGRMAAAACGSARASRCVQQPAHPRPRAQRSAGRGSPVTRPESRGDPGRPGCTARIRRPARPAGRGGGSRRWPRARAAGTRPPPPTW